MSFSSDLRRMFSPLEEGLEVLKSLDTELIEFAFDPHDEASVEAAVAEGERWVDQRLGPHLENPLVMNAAAQFKVQIADRIRARASELKACGA